MTQTSQDFVEKHLSCYWVTSSWKCFENISYKNIFL